MKTIIWMSEKNYYLYNTNKQAEQLVLYCNTSNTLDHRLSFTLIGKFSNYKELHDLLSTVMPCADESQIESYATDLIHTWCDDDPEIWVID